MSPRRSPGDGTLFGVGHRVMITRWGTDPQCGELVGYYGHIRVVSGEHYWVRVEGRVGKPASPLIVDANLWPFQAYALEHAD